MARSKPLTIPQRARRWVKANVYTKSTDGDMIPIETARRMANAAYLAGAYRVVMDHKAGKESPDAR